jgi:hypothetical protein
VVTLVPMLHVASVGFYDSIVELIGQLGPARRIVTEGVLSDEQEKASREAEWQVLTHNEALRQSLRVSAQSNSLYGDEVLHDICRELHLEATELDVIGPVSRLRLQAAYFVPLLASLYPDSLVAGDLCVGTSPALGSAELGLLGKQPEIKRLREMHCAKIIWQCARELMALPRERDALAGHVVAPWGLFHTDGIAQRLLSDRPSDLIISEEGHEGCAHFSFGLTSSDVSSIVRRS